MALFIGEGGSGKGLQVAVKRPHGVLQNDPEPNNLLPIHGIKEELIQEEPIHGIKEELIQEEAIHGIKEEPIHGIKEEVAGQFAAEKCRKSNLSTAKRVKYEPKAANLSRKEIPNADRKQVCDFFEADGSADSNVHVLETCMTLIKEGEDDPLVVCTLFAGALAAYYPSILQTVKNTLIGIGVDLNIIYLPKQANENAIDLEVNDALYVRDTHVIMGACVFILFKNISDRNYSQFISNRMRALAGFVGMTKSSLAELKQPATMKQAKYIRGKLGSDNNLKKELLLYLMALTNSGGPVETVSRYLCKILSWNEMTSFIFVYEKLWQTDSPVLSQAKVSHEEVNFAEAVTAVGQSQYPQFFRYFCSADELHLVQSKRFPVLAAVARKLKNLELLEEELVKLHNAFMATGTMEETEAVRLLTKDPEVAGYSEEDES